MRRWATAPVLALAAALAVGCTTREEPSERLDLCGNHSCGQLVMVTIDTAASGYQYLDPALSPDGTTLAFTADWAAIPSLPEDQYDEAFDSRQILLIDFPPEAELWSDDMRRRPPVSDIQELGARLVRVNDFISLVGGTPQMVDNVHRLTKGKPIWVDDETLIFQTRFSRRDRFLIANISNPGQVNPAVLFYEPDDLLQTGFMFYYHNDPALSPDGRWLVYTRFGCDASPNLPETICSKESIWVLDMQTVGDPTNVTTFRLTNEAMNIEDPAWSPDGQFIVFSSTTDLVEPHGSVLSELFRIRFDAAAAEQGEATIDNGLRRLTTTTLAEGDPIVGLQNYAPAFSRDGSEVFFVSSRRAPGTTLRGRSIWRIPADGRLEPSLLFFSRRDDVHPAINHRDGSLIFSSKMGFPTEALDALEQSTIEFWQEWNESAPIPLTEAEILRRAADARSNLEFFEDVMSHIYVFRRY